MFCFIILHYIVTEVTIKCVESILNNVKGTYQIIIVDNSSPNDSYNTLKEYFKSYKNVILIKNERNDGFADGNNFGYKYAMQHFDAEYICAMNNDMEINQNDFIKVIEDLHEQYKFGVLGPDIYSAFAGYHQNPEVKTIRTYDEVCKQLLYFKKRKRKKYIFFIKGFLKNLQVFKLIYGKIRIYKNKKKPYIQQNVFNTALHGSCLIFSKEYISKRDYLFYPKTKFYCEAQILDYECRRDGILMMYSPYLKVTHYEDLATNAAMKNEIKKMKFVNECMINSLNEFKILMENDKKRKN